MPTTVNKSAVGESNASTPDLPEHPATADTIEMLGNDILVLLNRADQLGLPFVAIRLDEAAALCLTNGTATNR